MDDSSFTNVKQIFPDAEILSVSGATCDCYRVRLYGKFHFLKRLKPELSTDPRYVAALTKEFETGYGLEHPNLVKYVTKGDDYLLTEYVDGESLSQFVVSHPDYFCSKKNTNRFLAQLLDVLGYLHSHQVVHLDLKPDNILITRIGNDVKLTDLGFCYSDTYSDTMGRTDKYAAPEQFQGKPVDARTDIYAVGKILEFLPCPYIYNKVIARCTKTEKEDRYQSTEDMLYHLPSDKSYSRWWLALLPVLILLLVIWLYPSSQTTFEKVDEHLADTTMQELPKHDSINEIAKPSTPSVKVDTHAEESLMTDVKQEVESNLAIVLDTYQDSIRRSRDPNYSAGTYLKALNITSARRVSVKYPHMSKDHIMQAIDEYTTNHMARQEE